ncbi:DUF1878 family protein [Oceanobacillus massiliensis]|uniref:DUF1878 family protein n=1 Tax=Oceanobacillus massiliensis TaxID=1465765 RepID=UPI000289A4AC|nr:DUF1878 family protein [Oceanobacillus massiliensis]
MEGYDQMNGGTAFHIQLLSKIIDMNQYPLIKLMIEKNISLEEYNELMEMLERLNDTYELQQEEGLLDFTSLLIHFAGMLNEKLDPNQTIRALRKEGYYTKLMEEFIRIVEKGETKNRRK